MTGLFGHPEKEIQMVDVKHPGFIGGYDNFEKTKKTLWVSPNSSNLYLC